ncbi:MAG: hypothetical protein NC395_04965, partial [Prevotella sp.]|nr:hypothetical protein [Prevotella sp.]
MAQKNGQRVLGGEAATKSFARLFKGGRFPKGGALWSPLHSQNGDPQEREIPSRPQGANRSRAPQRGELKTSRS